MPTYCFKNKKTGRVVERMFSMSDVPGSVMDGKKVFERDFRSELVGVPATKGWPLECDASGVHPDQAPELREHFKRNGLNIEVKENGNPNYANAGQRHRGLRCRGLVDKSSYC